MGIHKQSNPLKEIREKNNLSQEAFGSLAGVGPQVVIRNELGMFADINPSILRTCLALEPTTTEQKLKDEYEMYIISELAHVELPSYIPSREELDTVEGMKSFRKALTEANDMSDSNYSLCKLLKVHLYPIDRFMKGRKDTAPVNIHNRIKQVRELKSLTLTTEGTNVGG